MLLFLFWSSVIIKLICARTHGGALSHGSELKPKDRPSSSNARTRDEGPPFIGKTDGGGGVGGQKIRRPIAATGQAVRSPRRSARPRKRRIWNPCSATDHGPVGVTIRYSRVGKIAVTARSRLPPPVNRCISIARAPACARVSSWRFCKRSPPASPISRATARGPPAPRENTAPESAVQIESR